MLVSFIIRLFNILFISNIDKLTFMYCIRWVIPFPSGLSASYMSTRNAPSLLQASVQVPRLLSRLDLEKVLTVSKKTQSCSKQVLWTERVKGTRWGPSSDNWSCEATNLSVHYLSIRFSGSQGSWLVIDSGSFLSTFWFQWESFRACNSFTMLCNCFFIEWF